MIEPLFIRQSVDGIVSGGAKPWVDCTESGSEKSDEQGLGPPGGHDEHCGPLGHCVDVVTRQSLAQLLDHGVRVGGVVDLDVDLTDFSGGGVESLENVQGYRDASQLAGLDDAADAPGVVD